MENHTDHENTLRNPPGNMRVTITSPRGDPQSMEGVSEGNLELGNELEIGTDSGTTLSSNMPTVENSGGSGSLESLPPTSPTSSAGHKVTVQLMEERDRVNPTGNSNMHPVDLRIYIGNNARDPDTTGHSGEELSPHNTAVPFNMVATLTSVLAVSEYTAIDPQVCHSISVIESVSTANLQSDRGMDAPINSAQLSTNQLGTEDLDLRAILLSLPLNRIWHYYRVEETWKLWHSV